MSAECLQRTHSHKGCKQYKHNEILFHNSVQSITRRLGDEASPAPLKQLRKSRFWRVMKQCGFHCEWPITVQQIMASEKTTWLYNTLNSVLSFLLAQTLPQQVTKGHQHRSEDSTPNRTETHKDQNKKDTKKPKLKHREKTTETGALEILKAYCHTRGLACCRGPQGHLVLTTCYACLQHAAGKRCLLVIRRALACFLEVTGWC